MKLTPQQILLSSLLQLPITALEQRIKQELEMNPLLEETQELEETLEEEEEQDETPELELKQEKEDDKKEQEEAEIKADREKEKKAEEEVDWEKFLSDENNFEIRLPRDHSHEDDENEWIQPMRTTLADHLLNQLRMTSVGPREREIGEYIIWNLNDDGYLVYEETIEGHGDIQSFAEAAVDYREDNNNFDPTGVPEAPEPSVEPPPVKRSKTNPMDPVRAIAAELHATADEVEKVLKVVQSLDPAGIAARNLKECIILQLQRKTDGFYDTAASLTMKIITEAYEDFINRRYDKVSRQLKIPLESIKQAIGEILTLNPKPGEGYITAEQNYITPDVVVKKVNDVFEIILNDYGVPRLRINHAYRRMMLEKDKTQKDTKEFIKNKLEAAKWLINSLYRRRDTIHRTVSTIIELQKDFFEKGREFIKPMKLEDVASRIGMDISTISRATNGKYMQTDYGVFELKYFFSGSMTNAEGEDISTKQIKGVLKQVIEEEDKQNPLSDDELARVLTDRGTPIARRTITKYREQMMIPAARLRRQI